MNILRIIPAREDPQWVELLFQKGPYGAPDAPDYPLRFPMPSVVRQNVNDGYLYVVYRSSVIGYGKISKVKLHNNDTVGKEKNEVPSGDMLVLDGPLIRMPFALPCQSFRRFRYMETELHTVGKQAAEASLKQARLFPAQV